MLSLSTWMLVLGILLALLTTVVTIVSDSENFTMLILVVIALIFLIIGISGIIANSIQFGIDQLLESPGEEQSIFIYWYFWVVYLGEMVFYTYDYFSKVDFGINKDLTNKILSAILLAALVASTLCVLFLASFKKKWFLIDLRRYNPYKLVYKVTKFSRLHKVPVNRSAFTYCEDEIPSGLDLGKAKYGGPFTTEEVEDVKALFGILKVIFVTGPTFLLFTTFVSAEGYYEFHFTFNNSNSSITDTYIVSPVILESLTVFTIPIYLVLLRPFVSYYTPSMLKRIAVGIVVPTLLAMVFLVVDSLAHAENRSLQCMFS